VRTIKVACSVIPALDRHPESREYRVLVVKNSTAYTPGQEISRHEVDRLCVDRQWDVTIVPHKEGV
jgi:hypothetical protein